MSLKLRSRTKADLPQVAELANLIDPEWPVTAEKLELWESQRDPKYFRADYVAELDGRLVATGGFHEDGFAFEEGKYWIRVEVHPEFRRRGIGARFYGFLLEQLTPRNPKKLVAGGESDKAEGLRFLSKHGFVQEWERLNSRWKAEGFDFRPYAHLEQTLRDEGLEIKSLAELGLNDDTLRQLWELDWILFQDVPMGLEFTKREFEQFKKDETQTPDFVPEAVLIALDPKRDDALTGHMVGYTQLSYIAEAGAWVINMTGVMREYRGKKVAHNLKLRGMKLVAQRGSEGHATGQRPYSGEIRTTNDPPNRVMYEMNLKLGFKPYPSWLRFSKVVEGQEFTVTGNEL
ncbi:MAG: GNAT family N-acetyltransferase [Meiothermus sp.]|nr:GNAT family N-acetyltransferase [Meiothermus sp.]